MPDFIEVHQGLAWLRKRLVLPPSGLGLGPLYPWICWNLWLSRNQKVFSDRTFSEGETLGKAIVAAREWQEAQKVPISPVLSGQKAPDVSGGLLRNVTSVKTDAAWRKEEKVAGLSWIFSSLPAGAVSRFSAGCENVSSPLMAECLAIRSALFKALDLGIINLSLQTDCQVLAKVISSQILLVEVQGILADIFICISKFSSFVCKFIPRAANVETDTLAKSVLENFVVNF